MILKEVIFNSFYIWEGSGGFERTDFNRLYFGKGVVVLIVLIFNSF